ILARAALQLFTSCVIGYQRPPMDRSLLAFLTDYRQGRTSMFDPLRAGSAANDPGWPALPLDAWRDTRDTLHMYMQIIGKLRLALCPMTNQWWQVALYLTARGLTTSPMPHDRRTFDVEFDFIDHKLVFRVSDGAGRDLALVPRSVADFYRELRAILHE